MYHVKKIFLIILILNSSLTFGFYTHLEIVKEFKAIKDGVSKERRKNKPKYVYQYIIPKLDEVIPKYMQVRLRKGQPQRRIYSTSNGGLKNIDLRYRDTKIVSQVGGRCSAYGMIASIENLLGVPDIARISESHLWSNYRRYSSVKAVETAKKIAITEQSKWPHQNKLPFSGWREKSHTKLAHITFIEDNVLRAIKALGEGRPVYLGVSVTKSMERCESVLDPLSPDTGSGHALSISGYGLDNSIPGGGYFILKNSWSSQCGDKGYFYMPFNYCMRGGSSYCIMWDVQGVETGFEGVTSVLPSIPMFDLKNINVRFSSSKTWYQSSRTVKIEIDGESVHVRQIKHAIFSLDEGPNSKPVANNIDTINWKFKTKKKTHLIRVKFELKDSQIIEGLYSWKI